MNGLQDFTEGHNGHGIALAADVGFANGHQEFTLGDQSFVTIHLLALHDEDGVVIADGGLQQSLRFIRRERSNHFQAGNRCVHGFERLAVGSRQLACRSVWTAEDDGHVVLPSTHLQHFGRVVDDLVSSQNREVPRHEFNDGTKAVHRCTNGNTREPEFRNRRVNDTFRAELVEHSFRSFVRAVVFGDFFPHQKDVLVPSHFLAHGLSHGLSELYFAHAYLLELVGKDTSTNKGIKPSFYGMKKSMHA